MRIPAIFIGGPLDGLVIDVLQDSCGFCPIIENPTKEEIAASRSKVMPGSNFRHDYWYEDTESGRIARYHGIMAGVTVSSPRDA